MWWLQILAMNRGEHQGVLTVKIVIPENTYKYFFNFCQQKWLGLAPAQYYRTQLVMMSTEDSWERLGGWRLWHSPHLMLMHLEMYTVTTICKVFQEFITTMIFSRLITVSVEIDRSAFFFCIQVWLFFFFFFFFFFFQWGHLCSGRFVVS